VCVGITLRSFEKKKRQMTVVCYIKMFFLVDEPYTKKQTKCQTKVVALKVNTFCHVHQAGLGCTVRISGRLPAILTRFLISLQSLQANARLVRSNRL
jgi:hypothetical protein